MGEVICYSCLKAPMENCKGVMYPNKILYNMRNALEKVSEFACMDLFLCLFFSGQGIDHKNAFKIS